MNTRFSFRKNMRASFVESQTRPLFLLRGTGLCSLAMYDCTVRAVGSCLVSFGSLVYLQDAGSTGDGARELANVATHCFCTPSLTFEFLFFLFVFGQVIVLCHCFSFTPLWISYGVWQCRVKISTFNSVFGTI